MRLGTYPAKLRPGSQMAAMYGAELVFERHRHRYEVNTRYRTPPRAGRPRVLRRVARRAPGRDDRAARGTRFWVGTQAHPEFKSRPTGPTRCSALSSARPWPGPRAAART